MTGYEFCLDNPFIYIDFFGLIHVLFNGVEKNLESKEVEGRIYVSMYDILSAYSFYAEQSTISSGVKISGYKINSYGNFSIKYDNTLKYTGTSAIFKFVERLSGDYNIVDLSPYMNGSMIDLEYFTKLMCDYGFKSNIKIINTPSKTIEWLRLYEDPTVLTPGRVKAKHPNADRKDWAMSEDLKLHKGMKKGMLPEIIRTILVGTGSNQTTSISNNLYTDDEGRYWVAVGPNIMSPGYNGSHAIDDSVLHLGTKIDIVVIDELTRVSQLHDIIS